MHFQILQENFLKALTRITRIVPTKPQLPILQDIKLSVTKEGVEVITTNTETTEVVWLGGKVDAPGEICVSARTLFEFVATLSPDTIEIIQKEETLHVSCGRYHAEFPTISATEFPKTAKFLHKEAGELEKDKFISALSSVLFSAATDEGRPVLTGIKLIGGDEETQLVATDGYRLSLRKVALSIKNIEGAIIPSRALSEVVKLSAEEKGEKTIKVGLTEEKQPGFMVGDTTIFTRLIDGEYPAFEKIIPKTFTTRALVEKEPFLRAVRSAAIFARDNANIVRLNFDKQRVMVTAAAARVGANSIELEAKINGDGGDIAFNSRFLIDFLTNFPEEEFLFEMTGALNSGVFRPVKTEDYLHIIMPVRVTTN